MNNTNHLKEKITDIETLLSSLEKNSAYIEKCYILDQLPQVRHFFLGNNIIQKFIRDLPPNAAFVAKALIALDQADIIYNISECILTQEELSSRFLFLIERLLEIEYFYNDIGGLIGYHKSVLKLIVNSCDSHYLHLKHTKYIHPEGLYLDAKNEEVSSIIRKGIESLPFVAALFPMGGAGERLNLKHDIHGFPLPVAKLRFLGKTLLEGLVRDIQALEYLYFKLTSQQIYIPIAIMTSLEKDNHIHIHEALERYHWFHRPSSLYHCFIQPLVPVLTIEGNWTVHSPLCLHLKPSGHGVIWKVAEESGVFEWFEKNNRHKVFVRQINNPLAGCDHSILSLIGQGFKTNKAFGFLSCNRLLGSDEGSNVIIERKTDRGFDYTLTNIEYTEFAQKGIEDKPQEPHSCYSIFPSNTNILFADIPSIRQAIRTYPFPGQMINMKSKIHVTRKDGTHYSIPAGRLESMMQNIADAIICHSPEPLKKEDFQKNLKTFILYNDREKTISTTKKAFHPESSLQGTPEQAYYDLLKVNYSLLSQCGFTLSPWRSVEEYLTSGPSLLFLFHPALGPLHSIIAQKIRTGSMAKNSELQIELSEVNCENIHIDGSVRILSKTPLGTLDSQNILQYGVEPKFTLKNVNIHNQGIDREKSNHYWKNDLVRKEELLILLHEGSEFDAEDIDLEGSLTFEVPPYHRLKLISIGQGKWKTIFTPLSAPSWRWTYAFDKKNNIGVSYESKRTE